MAKQEQVKLLNTSVYKWNKWRKENPATEIDLRRAILSIPPLIKADFRRADLSIADLTEAKLFQVDLFGAHLNGADLTGANLSGANLSGAHLDGADLTGADLTGADLSGANLSRANLSISRIGLTYLGDIDLSETLGLVYVNHFSSSTLGTNTLVHSKGKIPEVFLRGCGLSDWEIEAAKLYDPNLAYQDMDEILYKVHELRASQPVQISPLFISYSHADGEFVDRLENHLNNKGIRFWRDIHDATSGKLEKQIDRAIRHNPIVLLILSKNSVKSDWVEHEVRLARELEKETQRDVLCPIALDESWKSSSWPRRVMEQVMEYNILDFSKWKDDGLLTIIFVKLIDGLDLYYKK